MSSAFSRDFSSIQVGSSFIADHDFHRYDGCETSNRDRSAERRQLHTAHQRRAADRACDPSSRRQTDHIDPRFQQRSVQRFGCFRRFGRLRKLFR